MKNIAIILAGGLGTRISSKNPKQFLKLQGKTCLEHTFLPLYKNPNITEIIIVANPKFIEDTKKIFTNYYNKKLHFIEGGKNRNFSTYNAIKYLSSIYEEANLLIHDGARPLINDQMINDSLCALNKYNATTLAVATTDTIIESSNNNIKSIPIRSNFMNAQTPQCFKLSLLLKAYKQAYKENQNLDNFSDDCGVFLKYLPNEKIRIIKGKNYNIKLTKDDDIQYITYLLEKYKI